MAGPYEVLALDVEGTLLSNAMSQFARPGLYRFLEFCRESFPRLVVFTTLSEERFRQVAQGLVERGEAPAWFQEVEYVTWQGKEKRLSFVPGTAPKAVLLADDMELYIHPEDREQWLPVAPFLSPYSEEDRGLETLMQDLRKHLRRNGSPAS